MTRAKSALQLSNMLISPAKQSGLPDFPTSAENYPYNKKKAQMKKKMDIEQSIEATN